MAEAQVRTGGRTRLGRIDAPHLRGAYSNHLRAVAAAGRLCGFATIGVVRGEEKPFNAVLAAAVADGMRLHYLDRASYRRKHEEDVLDLLRTTYRDFYLIPEGGTTVLGVRGCAELVDEIAEPFDLIACPVGTGGTLAGISSALRPGQRALGISVLRGAHSLDGEVRQLQRTALGEPLTNWTIDHRFHFGGFARRTGALNAFLADFADRHGLHLDPVYVGKMMSALFTLIAHGLDPWPDRRRGATTARCAVAPRRRSRSGSVGPGPSISRSSSARRDRGRIAQSRGRPPRGSGRPAPSAPSSFR
ncbi:1-aminocyclopropane-1-carboxylate deaminase/D-cysteine desulfhydrase [Pseudonocardia nigra]|uniref:1-aminocyclopropane-1-carboxylate deaminase/D-cysteine desulfhydrase n=1 Tax=Pseudonocardia nigra TaxID=1921578 RepID=UPI0027E27148|nr:pyridoxal-phosphate dependent enzyme [Pseudonocardia nigra]